MIQTFYVITDWRVVINGYECRWHTHTHPPKTHRTNKKKKTSMANKQENIHLRKCFEFQIVTVELNRGWNSRLGFSLQSDSNTKNTFISAIYSDSVAARDGRLKIGDQVLMVSLFRLFFVVLSLSCMGLLACIFIYYTLISQQKLLRNLFSSFSHYYWLCWCIVYFVFHIIDILWECR